MNPITDLFFTLSWFILLIWAIRLMSRGWSNKPVRDYNSGRLMGEWTTEVKKPVHPEMADVKPGTELMGVNFEQKTECDLEEYRDLQARIEQLREELEDEDDDGDIVVRV